jgi:hypothetical protein
LTQPDGLGWDNRAPLALIVVAAGWIGGKTVLNWDW